ncbi:MAG TPA: TolC family protein [Geomonas sp.]|nr:TolC family protein [Geomonas sp.]
MKSTIFVVAAWALVSPIFAAAHAAERSPAATSPLTLEQCTRLALKSAPELGEAQADIEQTASKLDEAKSYRFPRLEATALFGPAPRAHKDELFATDSSNVRLNNLTWFTSADATIIQPLYTFGKISENMKAATHGIEVDRSRKEQRAQEIALKVQEYYYGLLLARELKELVLEVLDDLARAHLAAQKLLEQGAESVDENDLYKLDAFSGEASKYLAEAEKGEQLALAVLKARLGLPPEAELEISSRRLSMGEGGIADYDTLLARARERRPEFRQIAEGLKARAALVEAAKADYYPDLFLGGLFSWAYAAGRDRVDNPYIADRFNHASGGIALGARWKLDFGITAAKVAGERAQYNRLLSTRQYAETNIPLQLRKFYLEAKEAEKSVADTQKAYSNAKKWAVSALANFDFGVGPAKEIFDALQAYARMRADYFQAIYNYRIAKANLDYACGESPWANGK